jgi:hypothetical protein
LPQTWSLGFNLHFGPGRTPLKQKPLAWLLEDGQPSVRLQALTLLLDKSETDSEARGARKAIPTKGWAADILSRQQPGGWWVSADSIYRPKYLSTNWMLLVLADLGMTKADPRIAKASERWIRQFSRSDGGFAIDGTKSSHLCTTGNTARALVQFGYEDHPAVRGAFRWMVEHAAEKGGWSCFGSGRNLDSWEPMSAFAVLPRQKWSKSMKGAVEKGAEFFLERELLIQGDHYEPWYRFHYPVHYYYDLLVGLDFMTALGYGSDSRLKHALGVLKKKRRSDGRWNLDAVHPDVEGGMGEWLAKHPKQAPTPFALEQVGEPSKMITLNAMKVLSRLGERV